jgi:Tfp pilus assembly protein PilX
VRNATKTAAFVFLLVAWALSGGCQSMREATPQERFVAVSQTYELAVDTATALIRSKMDRIRADGRKPTESEKQLVRDLVRLRNVIGAALDRVETMLMNGESEAADRELRRVSPYVQELKSTMREVSDGAGPPSSDRGSTGG